MSLSALPLPLSYTANTASTPITKIGDSVVEKNNRLKAKIGLSLLSQSGTTLQLALGFIGGSFSVQSVIIVTVNIY